MIFHETPLRDAKRIELEKRGDERGFFARTFCKDEFAKAGLVTDFAQHNTSFNSEAGTLRGLHFQHPPHAEAKVIRAVKGAIHDVIVDLRPGSASFGQWAGFDLTEEDGTTLYVPKGFGHGFQTLRPDTAVAYLSSHPYTPEAEGGVRWDDAALNINWPLPVTSISERDRLHPDLDLAAGGPFAGQTFEAD